MIAEGRDKRIWCAQFRRDRRELLPLFKLADDSEQQIASYLYLGEVFFASEAGLTVGQALVIENEQAGAFELKSIAVLESRQGQGIGSMLMRAVVRYCRMQNGKSLRVSTSVADGAAIGFYLRHGFRVSSVLRNTFTVERGYPTHTADGRIELNDAIELERGLSSISPDQRGAV